MKKLFLIIGVCSFIAAGIIVFTHGRDNPFSLTRKWWLAKKEYHGTINYATFSPDGEKLLFSVKDESGRISRKQMCIYLLTDKTLRRLSVDDLEGYISWAPDSRRIAFTRHRPDNRDMFKGGIFDLERDSVVEEFNLPLGGWGQPWSPDGKWLMFQSQLHGYVKRADQPIWALLPEELDNTITVWSRDGKKLLAYRRDLKKLCAYDVEENSLQTTALPTDFEIRRIFCSPYTNDIYMITSRKLDEYDMVVIRRFNLDSGRFTDSFDTGFAPMTNYVSPIFVSPVENLLYLRIGQSETMGKLHGESPRLALLDMSTSQTETVLSGEYRIFSYCGEQDMFAVTSKEDDHKKLYLFDVKTRSFEQIFP
jgi:Tol biopolymer transport system component